MTAAELAAVAPLNARPVGREWHAFCPVHRGKSRSLHFRDDDYGGILMICRAGCSTADVLAALGLSFRDISRATPRTKVPDVVRRAQNAARSSMPRNLPAAIRQQPVTVIYTDEIHINEAIARALALVMVNRELVQIVLRGSA